MKHQKKFKEPKDTMWGKCLSTFIAIVFAVSTLTIIPIAGAISGASTGATSEEMAALEAEKSTKQAEDEAAAISAANDKLSIDDIEDESKKDVSTDVVDTVLDTQGADADATDKADVDAKCDCTGEVHAKDCKAGLTGPIEIEATEPVVDETLITPAAEPEAPVWQLPDGEKTITAYSWCTNTSLGSVAFSTEVQKALGSEEGMNPKLLASPSYTSDGAIYTFHHAEALVDPQTVDSADNKYGKTPSVESVRFNQLQTRWEYKTAEGGWSDMSDKTLTFYYHYNQNLDSGASDVVLNSKDWPYTETEWLQNWRYTLKDGKWQKEELPTWMNNPACAIYQLYDSNGAKLDYQLRTYYYSPNVDRLNNSLSIANYWEIGEVHIMPLDGNPVRGQAFSYTAPDNFSQVNGVVADDPNNFTIPWESAWGKKRNVCLVAVKVKALPSEQALAVKYINNRTGAVLDTVNITAKKPNGTSSPVWGDYVTIAGNKVSANEGYAIDNGVKVDTNIADKPATISFALDRDGYNPEHVRAEVVKGDGVTAAEVLNLYYDPLSYTVTYTDGVSDEELFADKVITAYCDDPTPDFGGTPTREGYLFTGWDPEVADTVTGNATYTAQWAELYTVTYTDGVESEEVFADQVFDKLLKDTATPTIADPTRYGYVFAGWNPAVADKVSGNATYTAKWYEDKIDKDNPEKEGPDGIPDIYQKRVTFKVVNGNWNDDTNANTVHVLTFYKDGELSTDAAATAAMPAAPAVGNKPAAGYFSGYRAESWHAVVPTGDVTRSTVLDEYTYTYPAAYTVTYADGANGSVFTSQVAGNLLFDEATPAFKDDVNSLKRAGYVFAGWDKEIAPTVKGNITYTATWDEDVLGNDPSNPGNTDYSDGIADKYQTIVTFAGVGGTVNGKTQFDYVVTLKDAAGNNAIDGTHKLTEADVPTTAAAAGYAGDPVWTAQDPLGVEIEKPGATFIANWGNGFVAYYYDGVLGSAVDANVGVDQTIVVDAAQATTFEGHNYVLDRVDNNNSVVVAGDPGQNVVSVYYDLDEIGNDPDPANSGNIDYSDGVADKYQIVVSYAAVNGTINGIPRVVLDKFDADGKHAVDGTAVLAANQIPGTAPNAGFGPEGTWTPNVPVTDMQLTENTDFVITYAATPTEPTNPEEPTPGPTPGPGPDEPNPPVNPEEPTPTPTPTPTPEPTPGPEGPIAAVVAPPVVAAVTEGVAGAVEAIGDGLNPLAAITAPEAIDDDANALVAFEDIHCWTHWLMIFGALVTIVYGLGVLYMRRRAIHDFDDFEDNASGRKYDAAAEKNPATGNAFQAM